MATYVAFLRAINLGARRKFGKDAQRAVTEAAGCAGVETYLNTGNVRLETRRRSRASVEEALERAYLADRGFEVPTIAFTPEELRGVLADADALTGPDTQRQYVSLLKHEPAPHDVAALEARSTDAEQLVVRGRAAHLLLNGTSYRESRLTNTVVERPLGVATSRNLTVVRTVVERWCGGGSFTG